MNTSSTITHTSLFKEQDKNACDLNTRLELIQSLGQPLLDWSAWVFSRLKKRPRSRVLDLGCGAGSLWQQNREQIPRDWQITLSDSSPDLLKEAHTYLGRCNRHFAFQLLDARDIPFEDARFDILIANFLLSQFSDRYRAFSEIRRVLQADGIFYAATVTENAFATLNPLLDAAGLPPWIEATAFSLENGADQLTGWFTEVVLHRLTNTLVVREAEPLLRRLRSGVPQDQHDEARFQRLDELIRQELARHAEIPLTLDMGLFEAANRVE